METFGLQCFLWSKNQARTERGHGKRCIGIYSSKRLFPGVWCYSALTMAYQIQITCLSSADYQKLQISLKGDFQAKQALIFNIIKSSYFNDT